MKVLLFVLVVVLFTSFFGFVLDFFNVGIGIIADSVASVGADIIGLIGSFFSTLFSTQFLFTFICVLFVLKIFQIIITSIVGGGNNE